MIQHKINYPFEKFLKSMEKDNADRPSCETNFRYDRCDIANVIKRLEHLFEESWLRNMDGAYRENMELVKNEVFHEMEINRTDW